MSETEPTDDSNIDYFDKGCEMGEGRVGNRVMLINLMMVLVREVGVEEPSFFFPFTWIESTYFRLLLWFNDGYLHFRYKAINL